MSALYDAVDKMDMDEKKAGTDKNVFLYFVVCAVNVASLSAGIAVAWSSSAIPRLNGDIDPENNPLSTPITPSEESWIVSLMALGSTFGPVLFSYAADRIGRKNTILIAMVPLTVSFMLEAFASHVKHFYFARFLGGVAISAVFAVVPMYIGEISEDRNRGALGCFMPVFFGIGVFISFCIGPFVTIKVHSLLCTIPQIFFMVVGTLYVPESPHYFANKSMEEEACKSLKKLRNATQNCRRMELREIQNYVEESFANKGTIGDIFVSTGLRKRFIITVALMTIQQFSGINVVLSYMQSVFEATGSSIPSDVSTIIIGAVQMVACGVTPLVIDKLGRRILLLISAVGTIFAQAMMGTCFYMQSHGHDTYSISWLPILSLVVYMVAFNMGFGPLPWVILGEIFPPNIKSIASTVTASTCAFLGFTTAMLFPYFVVYVGIAQSFWFFAFCCAIGGVFVYYFVPETKGKSLLEIQIMLDDVK